MSIPNRDVASAEAILGDERSRRARRLKAMFDRWEAEDVADEPDWDVDDIEPIEFRVPVVESDAGGSE